MNCKAGISNHTLFCVLTTSTLSLFLDVFLSTARLLLDLRDAPHAIPVLRFIRFSWNSNAHPMVPLVASITADHWQVIILLSACWADPDLLPILIHVVTNRLCDCNSSSAAIFATGRVVVILCWSWRTLASIWRGDRNSIGTPRRWCYRWLRFISFASLCCLWLRNYGWCVFAATNLTFPPFLLLNCTG